MDPERFDADPFPTFYTDADSDPNFALLIKLKKKIRFHFLVLFHI